MSNHNDLPRNELLERAREITALYGPSTLVHFKYTCDNCNTRCTLQEPNTLFENGECHACGHKQPITKGGFMLLMRL